MPLRQDEISEVQEIARRIAKEEVAVAIRSLREELKAKPEIVNKIDPPSQKEEIKKGFKSTYINKEV